MTALAQYERLEATGIWRPGPLAQRREVIVSFGDATLVLADPRSEHPLAHWSLPAVRRVNPGAAPALFAPGGMIGEEELELSDPQMIDAIERIHRAIALARPHPGRLRGSLALALGLGFVAAMALWFPDAMTNHAVSIAPPAQRVAIGEALLADMTRVTGSPCARPVPGLVLSRLGPRLLGPGGRIVVLPGLPDGARALPGNIVVLGSRRLAGDSLERDAVLGQILAASTEAQARDPLKAALHQAGLWAVLRLLTSGTIPPEAVHGRGEAVLTGPPPRPDDDALLARFEAAGLSSQPYARLIDPSGELTLPLIEADPFRTRPAPTAPLGTEEWEMLKTICAQ